MGPPENPTRQIEKQEAHGRKRQACRPRSRRCLLKGCERRFRPAARTPALLQSAVPGGGAGLVGVEGPADVPGHGGGQAEAERGKASVTGSASKSENHQRKRRFRRPRGSSVRTFFDGCCDRPGCYECFLRSRRSPLQRFCSQACQRAMERVWERERRWQRRHGRHRRLAGRWPRARQP